MSGHVTCPCYHEALRCVVGKVQLRSTNEGKKEFCAADYMSVLRGKCFW
jgi:hypothetical protein